MVDKPPRVCGRRKNWAMSRLAVAVVGGGGEVRKAREEGGLVGWVCMAQKTRYGPRWRVVS